jgi:DNA-binding IclR family transcriptional regulator
VFWSSQRSRQRRAVITALNAVGENGMSLLALSVAVDIPEPSVQHILDQLIDSGQVRYRRGSPLTVPGRYSPRYHLVGRNGGPCSVPVPSQRPRVV